MSRILVRNGMLALTANLIPRPSNVSDKRLTKIGEEVYVDPVLEPYKNRKIHILDNRYRDIKFPDNYEFVHKDKIIVPYKCVAQDYVGYIESWSLYQGLLRDEPSKAKQFITKFANRLRDLLGANDLQKTRIELNYLYFIAMGRKLS